VSDGVGEPRTEAEGELALARIAMSDGEPGHAAAHLGNALATDPSLPSVYEALRELDAGGNALALFPMAKEGAYIGAAAARSYLLARSGAADEALLLLCHITRAEPTRPWGAADWLNAPGLASVLDPDKAAPALIGLTQALPDPVGPDLALLLRPFLDVARGVAARLQDPLLLAALSGLARRLGAVDEAITWCQRAEQFDRGATAAIMLGYALRSAGRFDEMQEAWQRALLRDPDNVPLHVDIAEDLAVRGYHAEGIAWLDRALQLEPGHEKAFPSACEMRFAGDGNISHLVGLADWWRARPEHGYADTMLAKACHGHAWLNIVPPPSEAISNVLAQVAERHPELGSLSDLEVSLNVSALEAPSAMAAANAAMPRLVVEVQSIPEPDIRIPLAEGRYQVWAYEGSRAVPAVGPPSPAAVAALRAVAGGGNWAHPIAAYDRAVRLSGIALGDLLGLMAHVPPVPDQPEWNEVARKIPAYWPRCAQVWACLGLLHYRADEPWPTSVRRAVLIDLVRGVEDWVTDAAMFALVVAAWLDPELRSEVAHVVGHRFVDAFRTYQQRAVTVVQSMASVALATPGMEVQVASLARDLLAREQQNSEQQHSEQQHSEQQHSEQQNSEQRGSEQRGSEVPADPGGRPGPA
jgi:tetratricopeptide (TPR) repeat protein